MSGAAGTAAPAQAPRAAWQSMGGLRRMVRDRPLIPLTGLLVILIGLLHLARPGIIGPEWASVTIRAAIPLAILAACQTLTMLTGGIDLSVGMVGSMAAYLMATQTLAQGPVIAILVGLAAAAAAGLATGIGVGVFRVHPLIMTLGMSLVVLGSMNVYQVANVQVVVVIPDAIEWLGSEISLDILPNGLLLFVPVAAAIILGLRLSGYGRLLFAVGDNPIAARLSGARVWQVHLALYILSALLAAVAGMLTAGLAKTASLGLVESAVLPSVAAAVLGGTSIMGGRGGYSGTILGALILTVLTTLLTVLNMPDALRQILFGAIIVLVAAAYTRVTGET
jgi:ribose transport system permease protein